MAPLSCPVSRLVVPLLIAAVLAHAIDLRVDFVRQSLTGTHIHWQQYIDGIPVIGGERMENIGLDGRREVVDHLAAAPRTAMSAIAPRGGDLVYLDDHGQARLVSRVLVEEQPFRRYANDYDAATGALIRSDALFWSAQGRVFDPNPVAKLNAPSLQDQNNAASAVPDAAYSIVDLPDLAPSGPLSGPNVRIVDLEGPHPQQADAAQPLLFDRSQPQFEEVNAYYHVDQTQRYLQSLGYTGARRIDGYAIPVDPHGAIGADNSYFVSGLTPGQGQMIFGDGGTDDAEDPDIILHEFGHAIQEWIAPGAFLGPSSSQSRALAEGFGDYWSFSSNYAGTIASGRDPFCIGDWDARCWNDDATERCGYPVGADCLRRVDGTKTMADFVVSDVPGTEHRNGEIWSSALREIFMKLTHRYGLEQGKRLADTLVLEGTFGVTAPTFAVMGRNLLAADHALDSGNDIAPICAAMLQRSILTAADCVAGPRGEVTWFQSPDHGLTGTSLTSNLTITDSRPIETLELHVDASGNPQSTLVGPDGTSASGAGTLDAFRGHSAGGSWALTVTSDQPVTLRSWSLAIHFQGDQSAAVRPDSIGPAQFIAAVAHASGANGTNFVSDVRLLNRGTAPAEVMAIFTPSGADGQSTFAAVKVAIPPAQIVTLDDVVQSVMQSAGTGQLELAGAGGDIVAVSRTYTRAGGGSYGQFIPAANGSDAVGSGDSPVFIPGLENTGAFRSNIGFAEVSGASGDVHVRTFDAGGNVAADETYTIAPFSHFQTRVNAAAEVLRAEVTVSGAAHVLAYGSVADNLSGDAIYIPAARERLGVFPAIDAEGAKGTEWRTDVWFSNATSAAESFLLPQRVPFPSEPPRTIEIPAGASVVVRNYFQGFGRGVGSGDPDPEPSMPGVLVTSRTYTTGSTGTFGQFIPALTPSVAPATLLGIENDGAFRTNIGVLAPSAATVRVIASDSAGREVWRDDVAANGLTQFPLPVPLAMGSVRVEVLSGAGVVPYASVVDNATGDPIFIYDYDNR